MWRTCGAVLLVMAVLAASASADHGPVFDVSCPTGSAQIVLDAGHGGPDPGAVNDAFGLHEADLNLEIALRVADRLREDHGYTVALTPQDPETELGNSERGAIANACGATAFIEIHLNASVDPTANYTQTFWGEKEKDLAFSQVMNDSLASLGIPVNAVERFDNGGLLRAKMPSILVEAVFLSNPEEAERLAQGTRQTAIVDAVTEGIVTWMALVGE